MIVPQPQRRRRFEVLLGSPGRTGCADKHAERVERVAGVFSVRTAELLPSIATLSRRQVFLTLA